MNKQLAKIKSVSFNIRDRGILMFHVFVDYEVGYSQGVGGLVLDDYKEDDNGMPGKRVGTAYGCEMIRQLLLTLDVDDFERAKGKIIWVTGEGEGLSFKPTGLETLSVYGSVKKMNFDAIHKEFVVNHEKK